ncbi:MAG TPA: VOC family protein [Tepidisphaeraceae bacterium]|jgi:catechol 2,3-dioxygenase-like lactoylglutathione lyase family enzyme
MTTSQHIGNRLVPALLVKDIRSSLAFYQRLGFECTAVLPDAADPKWAEVKRDGVALRFHSEPPHGTPTSPICSGTFYIYPDNVEALAAEWRGRVEFAWGPEVMEYGIREFAVCDPDGYFIAFAEPA